MQDIMASIVGESTIYHLTVGPNAGLDARSNVQERNKPAIKATELWGSTADHNRTLDRV